MRLLPRKLRPDRPATPRVLLPLLLIILFLTGLLTFQQTRAVPRAPARPEPPISDRERVEKADRERVRGVSTAKRAQAGDDEGAPAPVKCPHVVLFSSARHGSTWFIDSVERCRYSRSQEKAGSAFFASSVFKDTEPWKHKRSALFDMSGADVAEYVVQNSSVKVFSSTLEINRDGVHELAAEGARKGVPFVVLRREPEATYRSLRVAKETGVWNGVGNRNVGNVTEMVGFADYKRMIERYYAKVDQILRTAGVEKVDVVDYDNIREMKFIRLERNGCYVRNCNFE